MGCFYVVYRKGGEVLSCLYSISCEVCFSDCVVDMCTKVGVFSFGTKRVDPPMPKKFAIGVTPVNYTDVNYTDVNYTDVK